MSEFLDTKVTEEQAGTPAAGLIAQLEPTLDNLAFGDTEREGIIERYFRDDQQMDTAEFVSSSIALVGRGYITLEQLDAHFERQTTVLVRTSCLLIHQTLHRVKLDTDVQVLMTAMFTRGREIMANRSYRCDISKPDTKTEVPMLAFRFTSLQAAQESLERKE